MISDRNELADYAEQDGNDFGVIDTSRRQRRNVQRASTILYRYTVDGIALAALLAKPIPDVIPQPSKELVNAALILFSITAADVVNALTRLKNPLHDLKISRPIKYAVALTIPFASSVVVGFSIQAYGNSTHANATDFNPQLPGPAGASVIITNPLAHNALTGIIYYAQFGLIKWLLEDCCNPKPVEVNEEGRENKCNVSNVLQGSLKLVTDVIEPIALYEALRLILIETGREAVLHHRFFPLVVVGFDQLLKGWGHMSLIPKPLEDLVAADERHTESDYINEFINTGGNYSSGPSKTAIAKAVLYYSFRGVTASILGGLMMSEILTVARGQSDQEQLDSRDRIVNLMAITYATGLAEQGFDLVAKTGGFIWSKVSNCCSSMFSGSRGYQPVVTQPEDVLENDNQFTF